jgi:hypothetical protein
MRRTLRLIVRTILEAAANSQGAASAGLALMRRPDSQGRNTYVLYVPSVIEQMLVSGNIESSEIAKAIVGYMVIKTHEGECWNAGEVKLAAAQKGYGPLMYGYAMNDYAGGLFPDRGSTSNAARAVWQKYDQRADTKKSKFDDKRNPKTPDPGDDCDLARGTTLDGDEAYLNQAYDAPGDAGGRSTLMQNHASFVANMAQKKFNKQVVETMIENLGDEYFSGRYRDG